MTGVQTCALPIYKSQGSEFEKVLIILPQNEEIEILTKELLYTAITRAKNKVIIQATKENIINISNRTILRNSGISHKFYKHNI